MMGPMLRRRQAGGSPIRSGYWFAQKRYGYGAVPVTRMGWVSTFVFLAILGLALSAMPTDTSKTIVGTAVTIAYVAIVWLKTDGGWRWRWGDE